MNHKKIIHVAIAILNQQGKTLIAWRDEHLHQGGQYEFAGGKVEHGETPMQACRREVYEEVGIELDDWHNVDEIIHDYGDKIVHLHFYRAEVPCHFNAKIAQKWQWVYRDELANFQFPSANQRIIQRLTWQPYIKISANLADIEHINSQTQFYWRCLDELTIEQAVAQLTLLAECQPYLLEKCIINQSIYQHCSADVQALIQTLHLSERQLCEQQALMLGKRYIASCHTLSSIQKAELLGCDAVFCSPVQKTATHPNVEPLGWQTFAQWAGQTSGLVFALGGLQTSDLAQVRECGGFGVAGIRAF